MEYVPKIVSRQVGDVAILDLKGNFVGSWLDKSKHDLEKWLKRHKPKNLLINLKEVDNIDQDGINTILKHVKHIVKKAITSSDKSVAKMIQTCKDSVKIPLFSDEQTVVNFFGQEFVKEGRATLTQIPERREYPRLRTALPLICHSEEDKFLFKAIVTNFSQGGLYAEYLDLEPALGHPRNLDPYDFKMLNLKMTLPGDDQIHLKAKLTRKDFISDQMGFAIEFYEVSNEVTQRITQFLKSAATHP